MIYSKIDVRNGAIGVVPPEMPRIAVTSEFPVYGVAPDVANSHYIQLLFRTTNFLQIINGMISGASGRKRVQPSQLGDVEVPLPPRAAQQAIVAQWRQAQETVAEIQKKAEQDEDRITLQLYAALGAPPPALSGNQRKYMALSWAELQRWSFNYIARARAGLLGFLESAFPIVQLGSCIVSTMNGYCIKPVATETPYKMLKLSALSPSGLDLTESKFVKVTEQVAKRFSIRKGDLLMCRSVGSYSHVAKCALVETDEPKILFPEHHDSGSVQ